MSGSSLRDEVHRLKRELADERATSAVLRRQLGAANHLRELCAAHRPLSRFLDDYRLLDMLADPAVSSLPDGRTRPAYQRGEHPTPGASSRRHRAMQRWVDFRLGELADRIQIHADPSEEMFDRVTCPGCRQRWPSKGRKLGGAEAWLLERLEAGPRLVGELRHMSNLQFSAALLHAAADNLGVVKDGGMWSLPAAAVKGAER